MWMLICMHSDCSHLNNMPDFPQGPVVRDNTLKCDRVAICKRVCETSSVSSSNLAQERHHSGLSRACLCQSFYFPVFYGKRWFLFCFFCFLNSSFVHNVNQSANMQYRDHLFLPRHSVILLAGTWAYYRETAVLNLDWRRCRWSREFRSGILDTLDVAEGWFY